jgi:hypothetical protein
MNVDRLVTRIARREPLDNQVRIPVAVLTKALLTRLLRKAS